MVKTHGFPKKEKLKSKRLFEKLFSEGKSITVFPVRLLYVDRAFADGPTAKVGVVAPKKKFGSAVTRNRIKRMLREAYRRNKHLVFNNIEGNFAFLFLYLGDKMPEQTEVDKAVMELLGTFLKKESHEKNT